MSLTAVSLFAGIGGFDLSLSRAGVNVVAAVEIDPPARGVLARHFLHAALFSDVTEVTGDHLRAAGFVPGHGIITAGWPCQGNSVAGRRGGMADPRSGLWRHVVRLLAEARPRWFLGENVPGLLSINGGRDFGTVISDLDELGYGVCWRVLDAQHFGVPQRRRRVFIAAGLGDRAGPVEILLEPESGTGDSAAGRTAGEGTARRPADSTGVVGALGTTGPGGGWRIGPDEAAAGQLVAATIQGGGRRGHRVDAEGAAGGHLIAFDEAQVTSGENRSNPAPGDPAPGDPAPTLNQKGRIHVAETAYTLTSRASREGNYIAVPVAVRGRAGGAQAGVGGEGDPAFALRCGGGGGSTPMVAHTLTGEGFDASEDGTGRGTPIVPIGVPPGQVAATLTSGRSASEGVNPPGRRAEDDVNLVPMAFNPQTGGTAARLGYGETPTALQAPQVTAVHEPSPAVPGVGVRRLTPRECERLQGFPDDWTRFTADGAEQSDSARYRQCGNAVAVPVAEWVARRLAAVDAAQTATERGEVA